MFLLAKLEVKEDETVTVAVNWVDYERWAE